MQGREGGRVFSQCVEGYWCQLDVAFLTGILGMYWMGTLTSPKFPESRSVAVTDSTEEPGWAVVLISGSGRVWYVCVCVWSVCVCVCAIPSHIGLPQNIIISICHDINGFDMVCHGSQAVLICADKHYSIRELHS